MPCSKASSSFSSSSASSQDPVEILKFVAETFRDIFHAFIETFHAGNVLRFEYTTGQRQLSADYETDGDEVRVILTHFDDSWDDNEAEEGSTVGPRVPQGTNPDIAWAYTKWNLCDYSCLCFFEPLRVQIVEKLEGATIEWLRVNPKPLFIFRDAANPEGLDPFHSALLITLLDEGGRWVIDFTIEQFGFDRDMWFLTEDAYRSIVARDVWATLEYEEKYRDLVTQATLHPNFILSFQVLQKICEDLDWKVVEDEFDPEDRRKYLMETAKEALKSAWEREQGAWEQEQEQNEQEQHEQEEQRPPQRKRKAPDEPEGRHAAKTKRAYA